MDAMDGIYWTVDHVCGEVVATQDQDSKDSNMVNVSPLTSRIGAEISDITLSGDLSEDTVSELKKTLLDHKVLFFRDQDLAPIDHVAFGRLFGQLEVNPFIGTHPQHPELVVLERGPGERRDGPYGEDVWHSDVICREEPSSAVVRTALEMRAAVDGDLLAVEEERR